MKNVNEQVLALSSKGVEQIKEHLRKNGNVDFGDDCTWSALYVNDDGYAELSKYRKIELETNGKLSVLLDDGIWLYEEDLNAVHITDLISLIFKGETPYKKYTINPKQHEELCNYNGIYYPDTSMEVGEKVILNCEGFSPVFAVRLVNLDVHQHKDHSKLLAINKIICPICGSTNVRAEAWINPNTHDFDHFSDDSWEYGQCHSCNNYVELVNVSHTIQEIDKLHHAFIQNNGVEPTIAECTIRYRNEPDEFKQVAIKLNSGYSEGLDEEYFAFCDSIDDLKSLCDVGINDYLITSIKSFH